MSPIVLIAVVALGQGQSEKAVTDAEKEEFLELLPKLPSRGEFYTAEGITKAAPHTRVLLALTEKDLGKRGIYPFLALSRGLIERKEPREYGIAHFDKIAHPVIKLFWASVLFDESPASPEILTYLRKALESKEEQQILKAMSGPGFEDFKDRVIRASETGRRTKLELVKIHKFDELPESVERQCLAPHAGKLYALHAVQQRGELIAHDIAKRSTTRTVVTQPKGFKPDFDFGRYFDDASLVINSSGDVFCKWTIGGNGDHGIGILRNGESAFHVTRLKLYLADSFVVPQPDRSWLLIEGGPRFTVHRVEKDMNLTRLGSFAGKGHHTIRVMDAKFVAEDILHVFWTDVLPGGNYLRVRCIDFNVKTKKWLHDRELFRLDKFISSANEPALLQLKDGSLHYLWRVDHGAQQEETTGLYFQGETDGKTVKISSAYDFRAAAADDRLVVCYTLRTSPDKVLLRVVNAGTVGPETVLDLGKREHSLWTEDMTLYWDADRIWFVNRLASRSVYELKFTDDVKR